VADQPTDPLKTYMESVTQEAQKSAKNLHHILTAKYRVRSLASRISCDIAAALEGFMNTLLAGTLNIDKMKGYIIEIRKNAELEQKAEQYLAAKLEEERRNR
jgi:hypothetical protein